MDHEIKIGNWIFWFDYHNRWWEENDPFLGYHFAKNDYVVYLFGLWISVYKPETES